MLDNIVTPLLTYAPWAAALPPGGGGDPFVYQTDDDGMIDWFYAQEHFPGSVLPTGEIRTAAPACKDVVDTLIGIARNYGELSLMVRPAEGGAGSTTAFFRGLQPRPETFTLRSPSRRMQRAGSFTRGRYDRASPVPTPADTSSSSSFRGSSGSSPSQPSSVWWWPITSDRRNRLWAPERSYPPPPFGKKTFFGEIRSSGVVMAPKMLPILGAKMSFSAQNY